MQSNRLNVTNVSNVTNYKIVVMVDYININDTVQEFTEQN